MMRFSSWAKPKQITIKIAAILFWLLVWEAASRYVGREILLVSPVRALNRLFELSGTAGFWRAVATTCRRVLEGFGLSILAGSIFAIATSRWKPLKHLFDPLLSVLRATPVAAVIILALVWLARVHIPVFVVSLMVLPIVWTNLYAGLQEVDQRLVEMGKVFHFSRWKQIRYIYIPALMPYIVSALVTGLGIAWRSAIGAEVLARPQGTMGSHIMDARIYLQPADLFAWAIAVIALSILLEKGMVWLLALLSKRLAGKRGRLA